MGWHGREKGENSENGKLRAESKSLHLDYKLLPAQPVTGLGTVPCTKQVYNKHQLVCMIIHVNQQSALKNEKS